MKKSYFLLFVLMIVFLTGFGIYEYSNSKVDLHKKHQYFLDNSPYKQTKNLSKEERKKMGLPPNAYNEQKWDLEMDPATGRPMFERAEALQRQLREQRELYQSRPGGSTEQPWIDRGPNNIGGRTRGVMFDPNDPTNSRVFAGGVSGGLWVNNDITNSSSPWTQVSGIAANVSVTNIISDPNNSNVFYMGSGESYVSGDVIGNGIYKSTDGGVTWSQIFGGATGTFSFGVQGIDGIFYINDLIARDIGGGNTELYAAVASAFHADSGNPNQWHSLDERGLYRSTDDGTTWNRVNAAPLNGDAINPNDLELDINNNIWLATTNASGIGATGGRIFRSTDGINWTNPIDIPNAARTEIEPSNLNPNKFWIAIRNSGNGEADLLITTNAFNSVTNINEPQDDDLGIPNTDYCRGQAFYDLPIEADANDNLYVGGIDLFRSTNDGTTWTQISKWSNNNNLGSLNVPLVHADQHAIVFRPGGGNGAVFGNDGGVYYSPDITVASTSISIDNVENGYNTTQLYSGAIDDIDSANGDDIGGGTQDNGSPFVVNNSTGAGSYVDPVGGDGGYTEIDNADSYVITSYPGNSHQIIVSYPTLGDFPANFFDTFDVTIGGGGSFINDAALDKNLDILYAVRDTGNPSTLERAIFDPTATTQGGINVSNVLLQNNTLLTATPSALKVSPYTTTQTNLFVGLSNGRLIKMESANAGTRTDSNIAPSGAFLGSISDIEFGTNENEIFITLHNYGVDSIWYTSNGGTSWTSLEGDLPDMPVKSILQNPLVPDELIIGTIFGVWTTPDFTATPVVWTQSNNGMSDTPVVDLDLRASDNTILASTFGRGFFTSTFTNNSTWTGAVDSNWDNADNWSPARVPDSFNNVLIPGGLTNYPNTNGNVAVNEITIESGATLITEASSTFTAPATYKRNLSTSNWYLLSSPVSGAQYDDTFVTNNDIASGSGNNRGIAPFNTGANNWDYYQSGTPALPFNDGQGYSILRTTPGDVSFSGTGLITTDVSYALDNSGSNRFNLIGNPFTSFIPLNTNTDANNILDTNSSILQEETVWMWNQANGSYDVLNQATASRYIAPGQGFFVKSNATGGNFSMTRSMRSHQSTDTFQRPNNGTRPEINLTLTDQTISRNTEIYYINGTTTDIDNGYDSTIFGGTSNSFMIYSQSVSNDQGKKLGIQSLPDSNYNFMVIPIGVNAQSGKTITISAESSNLPLGYQVYLEDKNDNSFTLLDSNTFFTETLSANENGFGRFYIHTTNQSLSADGSEISDISIYNNQSDKIIRVLGVYEENAELSVFSMTGKKVLNTTFDGTRRDVFEAKNLTSGVYIVQIKTLDRLVNKKILLK